MKPEYLFKVGNLFVKKAYTWSTGIELSEHQKDAGRYDLEEGHKAQTYLKLHKIPYTLFNVSGPLVEMTELPAIAEVKKKETV